tara:strand:- start:7 stop:726 length:720 start_codon:yes stop_codon:yes gene_type:complete
VINIKDKVLLVGSGSSLKESNLGQLIDNFDGLVCRFNGFKVDGYEKDIGSRTDIWCMNSRLYYDVCFEEEFSISDDNIITYDDLESYGGEILVGGYYAFWGKYVESMSEALSFLPNSKPMHKDSLIDSYKQIGCLDYCDVSERNQSITPTTGFESIMHFLKSNYEVYIIGFDYSNQNLKGLNNNHYYGSHQINSETGNNYQNVNPIYISGINHGLEHDLESEKEIINRFELLNIITRLD